MLLIRLYQKNDKFLVSIFLAYALHENISYIPTKYGRNQSCIIKVYATKLKSVKKNSPFQVQCNLIFLKKLEA